MTTPLFTQHARQWRDNRYVYPVISRRSRGLSIGINLSLDKVCTFKCVYCSVDRTGPSPGKQPIDLELLRRELESLLAQAVSGELFADGPLAQTPPALRRLNDLAFSGDGEPTAAREFPQAARIAAEARARAGIDARIVLITNATLLDRPEVVDTLSFLDAHGLEVWGKLDAGTDAHYQAMDRSFTPLAKVLSNLLATGRVRPIVIQSMFAKLHGQAPAEAELDAWAARVRELVAGGCQVQRVQVYTAARKTAEPFVQPLEVPALEAIAERVRAFGLLAETFG